MFSTDDVTWLDIAGDTDATSTGELADAVRTGAVTFEPSQEPAR